MKHTEYHWTSTDGIAFFAQSWAPDAEPKAVICLVHGLGEHSGRYAHVAAALVDAGYAMTSFDQRGHGKTGGKRGHAPSMEALLDDITRHLDETAKRFPGLPRFLYGHSMGGLLTLAHVESRQPQLTGVVATSSGLRSVLQEQPAKIMLVKILGSLLPRLSMPTGLDANGLSHDPEVARVYLADPLNHGIATLGLAKALLTAIKYAFAHAAEIKSPLLLVHGTADPITYPSGSQEFAALVPGACTLKLWDGLYHETHNELEKEQVLAAMVEWLDSTLTSHHSFI